MAWRIHESVLRGEIDNRQRGIVRGSIWLAGMPDPVRLELRGNACPDLAGCLLTFENPAKTVPLRSDVRLAPVQRGTVGDLTASRKVRVPDVPTEASIHRRTAGEPAPDHLANCLYLEWYSEANGRVLIESAGYHLSVSAPLWSLSPEEEQRRQRDASSGFAGFIQKLSDAVEAAKHQPPEDRDWDEFDYEKLLRESDARTDKYAELLNKYLDHPERDRIIAREMGWTWLEEALDGEESDVPSGTASAESEPPDEPGDSGSPAEPATLDPDPATEGVDWVRDADGDIKHPLSLRVFRSSTALWHRCDELGLRESEDADLGILIAEFQITGAKLAGALDSLAYGRELREGPFVVAYLKRALNHLHTAQAALERAASGPLLPSELVDATRRELFQVREEILRLMGRFRGQL